jgi:hypothetical protein
MTQSNVAQQHRNARPSDVAQRAPRDRSTYIRRAGHIGRLLGAAVLGLGCAAATARPDGGSKDSVVHDGSAVACADDCAASGLACSLGRCTSMACATVETNGQSVAGCLFYTLQADNVTADEAATTSFLVSNPGPDAANVALQTAQPVSSGSSWTELTRTQILAGASARLPVSGLSVTGVGVSSKAGLRISSDRPVTVAEIESDDVASVATSSGGTMILPLQSLGKSYRAMTYAQEPTTDVQQTAGSLGGAGRVMIVGTHDGTTVTFTPLGATTGAPGGDLVVGKGQMFILDDGDVFQIYSEAQDEDLTGATVSADFPVAVFSGNISTTYGLSVSGINSADMAHEQMPPVSSWSKNYVAAALTPQASIGCTSFFGPGGGSIWRVLSSKDGNQVTVAGPGIQAFSFALDAGAAQTIVQAGSFSISADAPILVTQGIDCEPSLSLAVAVGATSLFKSLPLAVPPQFDLLLSVVRASGTLVKLDGVRIAEGLFQTVEPGYDVAAVPLPPCVPSDASGVCTHLLQSTGGSGSGFGVTLRGMDVGSSFALTPPLLVGCDPSPCVN